MTPLKGVRQQSLDICDHSPNKHDPSNSSLEKSSKVCLELHSLKLAAHPEDQWLEDESSFWGQKVYFQGQAASSREGYLFAKVDHVFWEIGV